jgi:amino-acid N-acetyltransferase
MLTQDPLERLRPAKIDDIGGILQLIEPLEADGILVKRSRDLLEMEVDRFVVLEHDRIVTGCAALYPFPEEGSGELACLAVHPDFRGQGAGERLMEAIEAKARRQRIKRLFVLTTRTEQWFVERGYSETTVAALPRRRQTLYNYQRRSVVLMKRV